MKILCTDLEGTLAPEIWQEIGRNYNIPELSSTTREIPDFEDLMNMRMEALQNNAIKYSDLKDFLKTIDPYQGAKEFLNSLKDRYQIVIVSDTFYELALPLIEKLGDYPILCHHLNIKDDYIESYSKRQNEPKRNVVKGFKSMNYECFCMGDSYNDIQMIDESNGAFIFAPKEIKNSRPDILSFDSYNDLKNYLLK
ncbi:MAG: bifunctional phosphoserine phosphatase/homoserine phosphotransferase ThrH [Proteobacteria bacterium]|uniref:phosphoserine phosphatase n=1 Tax=SAR86 cluster bacterium TaxID=2030880 RepID=A0A937LIF8_9GAMM|nr:bifunctional phosphoserine phosphatase/homoserine phosphotransferase ThrH [SAR86 cluster bacterium]MBL6820135.1 bifunctional phosphoserine phosphatase/homoserine phosphotransferase ThrH [SAR86 cluster bacterium]MDA0345168.1 bifunctional phosphoserine phosphatase/homoserine phosphotransferase ThrH [Pseudomonadota bacterium]MDA0900098.1 bifunctional phosphoserine phosphatase/homoserine phosphotransferase ThrH [Pseudomonadota bacterium]MDA1057006.1 bifunctional phosphoserine phosphatase/homoser